MGGVGWGLGDLMSSLNEEERKTLAEEALNRALKICNSGEDLKRALKEISLSVQLEPNFAEAHNLKGVILDLMEEKDAAIISYEEAIRLDPIYADAVSNLREIKEKKSANSNAFSSEDDESWDRFFATAKGVIAFLFIIGGLFLFYRFGLDYVLPKNTIIIQPDYSQINTVTRADLEETADTLSERADALGYSNISFSVANGQIIGVIPRSVDANELFERISPVGLLEFVNFGSTPIPAGDVINTDFRNLKKNGKKEWHTILTNEHFEEATVTQGYLNDFQIAFSLTKEGNEIFAKYTSENIGAYLGIVLDKVVISAPRIQSEITGRQGMITGQFTQEEAENLAAILQTKALPFPIEVIIEDNAEE